MSSCFTTDLFDKLVYLDVVDRGHRFELRLSFLRLDCFAVLLDKDHPTLNLDQSHTKTSLIN